MARARSQPQRPARSDRSRRAHRANGARAIRSARSRDRRRARHDKGSPAPAQSPFMPAASPKSAKSTGYVAASRAPRYSLLFALPLLLGYEVLASVLAQPGKPELRNGADALLRGAAYAAAG